MLSPLAALLRDLSAVFEGLHLPWYLFGAQAAIVHGAARVTADVDATVHAGATSVEALEQAMARGGFEARVADLAAFAARTRVLPLVHRGTRMPVDVVLAGPGLEEAFLERARIEDVGGVGVPVAAPEDVIIMKILAGRAKDLEDVVAVLEAQGDALDIRLVRTVLQQLEEALGRADLVAVFGRLAARSPGSDRE